MSGPADFKSVPGFDNWPRFVGVIEQNKISDSYENYCIIRIKIFQIQGFIYFLSYPPPIWSVIQVCLSGKSSKVVCPNFLPSFERPLRSRLQNTQTKLKPVLHQPNF